MYEIEVNRCCTYRKYRVTLLQLYSYVPTTLTIFLYRPDNQEIFRDTYALQVNQLFLGLYGR